ncbi:MAG: hypothetical protein QW091_00265 [Candidatus Micrarchaeaceae archaeon]
MPIDDTIKTSSTAEHGTGKNWHYTFAIGLAVLVILLITIYLRIGMLKYYGFYEPDDYYHFSVIRAAVANNFIVPMYLRLSGWPAPTITGEPKGLYYTVLAPYFVLRFLGISYYTIMRYIALIFGIFDVIGAYFLARYLSKDKLFGLLAMLFVALNMGDAARTSALIFRGDSFVTLFIILALVFAVAMSRATQKKRKLMLAVLAGFTLSIANFVWNGAPFTTVVFMLFFILLLIFGFVFDNKKMLLNAKYLLVSFAVWFAFVSLYRYAYLIMGQTFTGLHFIPIFVLFVIGAFLFDFLAKRLNDKSATQRAGIFILVFALSFLVLYAIFPTYVVDIVKSGSFLSLSPTRFAETIEELQPPNSAFLQASFGMQLYLVPMNYAIIGSTFSRIKFGYWFLMIALTLPYFFMHIFDSNGFNRGKAKLLFGYDEALLAVIAYFITTAYLQMNAIRFNSLVSVPLSIFAAYTVYWLISFAKRRKTVHIVGLAFLVILIVGMFSLDMLYTANLAPADEICLPQFFCYTPSNPPVVQALSWLKNNSPSNSVVLTLWPDGSLVEGIANRTSVTDSVGSQNSSKANPFAAWLLNSSPDAKFLLTPINGKPDYLLTRYAWLVELGGIYTESGYGINNYTNRTFVGELLSALSKNQYNLPFTSLNQSQANVVDNEANSYIESLYGADEFTSVNEQENSTSGTETLTFSGYYIGNYSYISKVIIQRNATGQHVGAFLFVTNVTTKVTTASMFANVIFYNMQNVTSSILNQAAYTSNTNSYSLLVTYSPLPSTKLPINITGAYMVAPNLAKSNMFKFLYECGYSYCPWNNTIASLKLVYSNLDSKIFEIMYNATNATIRNITYH